MSDIIQLLPDSVANQIAAGEVVQRPASVVKELMENAIDAGATCIELIVKDAGKSLIQVVDNGKGMTENDARMCFERHATSKIRSANDLWSIKSFGFRGEALASIAAIAQIELKTKTVDADLGIRFKIEASEFKGLDYLAWEVGTSISVKNLFYNVPARRNFLKSDAVELRHITDEFIRIAISRPDIRFSLFNNDLEMLNLPSGNLAKRIVQIFGESHRSGLVSCAEETPYIKVKGFIGTPNTAKKSRGEQFLFVNERFIRHHYFNHAIKEAYEGLIPEDHTPFYVLFFEIDPKHVDVNIHPTKTEVKFDDERTIYGMLRAAVKQSLGIHNVVPSLDFSEKMDFSSQTPFNERDKSTLNSESSSQSWFKPQREVNNQENWEALYQGFANRNDLKKELQEEIGFNPEAIKIGSALNTENVSEEKLTKEDFANPHQIHNSYISIQVKTGLMLIQQQSAHERILYERYMEMMSRKYGSSQQFLFPQTIQLNASDFILIKDIEKELQMLGFSFSTFSNNTIVLNGIPADLKAKDEKAVLEGVIQQYKSNKEHLKLGNDENLSRSLAKRTGIKLGEKLEVLEINQLIQDLFRCKNPNYSPEGQKIFTVLSLDSISGFFQS